MKQTSHVAKAWARLPSVGSQNVSPRLWPLAASNLCDVMRPEQRFLLVKGGNYCLYVDSTQKHADLGADYCVREANTV